MMKKNNMGTFIDWVIKLEKMKEEIYIRDCIIKQYYRKEFSKEKNNEVLEGEIDVYRKDLKIGKKGGTYEEEIKMRDFLIKKCYKYGTSEKEKNKILKNQIDFYKKHWGKNLNELNIEKENKKNIV